MPVLPGRGDAFYVAPVGMDGDEQSSRCGIGEHEYTEAERRAESAISGGGEKDTGVPVQAGPGTIEKQDEWEEEQRHPARAEPEGDAISSDCNCTPSRSRPSESARRMTYVPPTHDHFTDTPPLSLAADTAPPASIACDTASPAFVNEATPSPPGVDTQPNKDKSSTDHERLSPGEQVLQATIVATVQEILQDDTAHGQQEAHSAQGAGGSPTAQGARGDNDVEEEGWKEVDLQGDKRGRPRQRLTFGDELPAVAPISTLSITSPHFAPLITDSADDAIAGTPFDLSSPGLPLECEDPDSGFSTSSSSSSSRSSTHAEAPTTLKIPRLSLSGYPLSSAPPPPGPSQHPSLAFSKAARGAQVCESGMVTTGETLLRISPDVRVLNNALLKTHCSACLRGPGHLVEETGRTWEGARARFLACGKCEAVVYCSVVSIL